MSENRPSPFPQGTPLGEHFAIEGLVRLAEGRMFYLANENRPDRHTRKCWLCGHESTPRSERACEGCGKPFEAKRFLVSARWDPEESARFEAFCQKGLSHPGLALPLEVLRSEEQVLAVMPYNGEGLMVDEPSPLSNERILDASQRIAGVLAYLQVHGVQVRAVTRANLLVAPDLSVRLYDPDIESVGDVPITNGAATISSFGEVLRRFCDVEAMALADFLEAVEHGEYPTPMVFGRAVEQRLDGFAGITYRPLIGAMSDVGLIRALNEDNWGWRKLSARSSLFVIADGMGGHEAGEVASALAVETICRVAREREALASPGLDAVENLLDEAFQTANNTIKDQAEERGTDMGTTLVSMLILEGKMAFIANVGDSRAYLMRNDALHQVSRDHSLVAKMVEKGKITAEEARNHPHSNILLRTVGTEHDVDIDLFRVDLESGDRVLMCTDGLWGEVEDRQMEEILRYNPDPRFAARELVRSAHQGGGKDNVTLLLVTVP